MAGMLPPPSPTPKGMGVREDLLNSLVTRAFLLQSKQRILLQCKQSYETTPINHLKYKLVALIGGRIYKTME